MTDTTLTDTDIAARIRAGRRCAAPRCRELAAGLCHEHRDELDRILNPDYAGDRDLELAASIPRLFARLDPTPGRAGDNIRVAGFRSSPPCHLDPIVMRDHRSAPGPVVDVWFEPRAGGIGDDLDRPHYEDPNPPRSVLAELERIVGDALDDLGELVLADDIHDRQRVTLLCAFLFRNLDLVARRCPVVGVVYRDLAELHRQLRPLAGYPAPKPVASCTGWVRDPVTRDKVECGAPLFLPPPRPGVEAGPARPPKLDPTRPVMRCRRCDRPYTTLQLLRLEIAEERAS